MVIFEPHWHSYARLADNLDLNILNINGLNEESLSRLKDISFDAMIICNPNNPDGTILDKALMDYAVELINSKNAIIIVDEIYSHYDYDGKFRSFSKYQNDRIYVVNGFSKRYAMTGWRLGFILNCNNQKLDELTNINSMIATCVSNISQYCGIAAIKSNSDRQLYHYYKSNRDLVLNYFPSLINKLKGGLYAFVDLSDYGLTLDGEIFSQKLFTKFKIAVVPGAVYGNSYKSYFRICFSVDREELRLALEKISLFIKEIVSY